MRSLAKEQYLLFGFVFVVLGLGIFVSSQTPSYFTSNSSVCDQFDFDLWDDIIDRMNKNGFTQAQIDRVIDRMYYVLNQSDALHCYDLPGYSNNQPIDVVSVTDLSGSMAPSGTCSGADFWCCFFSCSSTQAICEGCGGTWTLIEDKLGEAINANNAFIDAILNDSQNKIGLVGYNSDVNTYNFNYYHELSQDNSSLHAEVDSWTAGGPTCICCGINVARNEIVANSTGDRFRSIVLMSDGIANVECTEQGTGDPISDSIQAACDAYNNHSINVYSIGLGSDVDGATMQAIASCGNGNYYPANSTNLTEIYELVSQDILRSSFN